MIRAQLDIFGGSKRIDPWVDICIQKLKRYCPTPPFSKTEMHKIIAGEIYAEIPKMDQVVRGILKAGNVEDGRKLIAAAFRHNDFGPEINGDYFREQALTPLFEFYPQLLER